MVSSCSGIKWYYSGFSGYFLSIWLGISFCYPLGYEHERFIYWWQIAFHFSISQHYCCLFRYELHCSFDSVSSGEKEKLVSGSNFSFFSLSFWLFFHLLSRRDINSPSGFNFFVFASPSPRKNSAGRSAFLFSSCPFAFCFPFRKLSCSQGSSLFWLSILRSFNSHRSYLSFVQSRRKSCFS